MWAATRTFATALPEEGATALLLMLLGGRGAVLRGGGRARHHLSPHLPRVQAAVNPLPAAQEGLLRLAAARAAAAVRRVHAHNRDDRLATRTQSRVCSGEEQRRSEARPFSTLAV